MKLQHSKTVKLFYDKFLYRVTFILGCASIFRDKNLPYARQQIDILQQKYDTNSPLTVNYFRRENTITEADFLCAKYLYNEFSNSREYTLRIEHPRLNIYTNDEAWCDSLIKSGFKAVEYAKPDIENLAKILEGNTIIVAKPFPYSHKITLDHTVDRSFYNWIMANRDKIKIGNVCLESIKEGNYCRGYYFYIRDERILQLVNLMIGPSISRVDKIVSTANSDK